MSYDCLLEKITRKRKTKDPCPVCFLNQTLCICALIPRLELKTRVCLVVHAKELKRTTNTGRLALHALTNSEMRVRGATHEAVDLSDLLNPDYHPVLFYPSDEAIELDADLVEQITKPILLIVPDGNWRQASKVHYRHQELKGVPRVKISSPNIAKQHLRAESTENGMSTLQAVAMAITVIEGSQVGGQLEALYQAKLSATLVGRGHAKPHRLI